MKRSHIRTLLSCASLGLCCLLAIPAWAQENVTVLRGARIIDGNGGPPIDHGTIVLRGPVIDSIAAGTSMPPEGAVVIDLAGKTVMPALIAGHAHLGMTNGTTAGSANITEQNVLRQLRKYARHGIGTVVSFGTDHDFIYALRTRSQGSATGLPHILTAGRGFGVTDGAPPVAMGMDKVYRPASAADAERDVDLLAAHRPDLVKIWVDDMGRADVPAMRRDVYHAIIAQSHRHGLKVAAHVYYLGDAKQLARDGIDIFGHSVRDRDIDNELAGLMKSRNIAYIPTLALDEAFFAYADRPAWMADRFFRDALDPGVWDWLHGSRYQVKESARKDLATARRNVLALQKAGIRIGLGTDSGATVARLQGFAEHRELQLLVAAGLTPMQALQAATRNNAEIFGIAGQRGTLAPGKHADILVLDANPLDDIRNTQKIHALWLEGTPVPASP